MSDKATMRRQIERLKARVVELEGAPPITCTRCGDTLDDGCFWEETAGGPKYCEICGCKFGMQQRSTALAGTANTQEGQGK